MVEKITLWLPARMLYRPLRVESLRDVPPLGMGALQVAPTLAAKDDPIGLVELATTDGRTPQLREAVVLRRGDAVAWQAVRRCFCGCMPIVVEPPKPPKSSAQQPSAPGRVAAVAAPTRPSKAAAAATMAGHRAAARLVAFRAASPSPAPSSRPLVASAGG